MTLSVMIEDQRWTAIGDVEELVRKAVSAVPPAGAGEINVLFTGDNEMRGINKIWRNIDKPTNVLSFPAAALPAALDGEKPLGDIVLAYDTVAREAADAGKPADHHTLHLVVHGILHLLGYDHGRDSDAAVMEQKEREILAMFNIPDPYAN